MLYHRFPWLCGKTNDPTSKPNARKLVRHSPFGERSSPAVKARAPTSSTTKLWLKQKKQQLFIFPNSLTIHQTSTLYNTFYFNNTWTKIQLRSDPVNMQPDKTKCYLQRPIITLWPAASKMLSTSSGSPPPNSGALSLHIKRNCRIRRGDAGYWNVTLATTRRQACLESWCSQANIRRRKGKMWWLIEICINCVVHRSFDGYHELNGD